MMAVAPCLTLLTDFGLQDSYVGVMKGAIAQIAPTLPLIDLTHIIAPQDILSARFNLMNAYPYFPAGTVHVVVVDPGVGSTRRAIALSLPAGNPPGIIVAPDNGVVSGVLTQQTPEAIASMQVVELTRRNYWRVANPSHTFHGRDIFAPVGAHLASGVPLDQVGDFIDANSLIQIPIPAATIQPGQIEGTIQYIDHFGNGITTIPATALQSEVFSPQAIRLAEYSLASHLSESSLRVTLHTNQGSYGFPYRSTYAAVGSGDGLALVGSHGWLEVSVNQGNAAQAFDMNIGDRVEMRLV